MLLLAILAVYAVTWLIAARTIFRHYWSQLLHCKGGDDLAWYGIGGLLFGLIWPVVFPAYLCYSRMSGGGGWTGVGDRLAGESRADKQERKLKAAEREAEDGKIREAFQKRKIDELEKAAGIEERTYSHEELYPTDRFGSYLTPSDYYS